MKNYNDYLNLLNEFSSIPFENYSLDRVYDEQWFRNDLIRIIESFPNHLSQNRLNKELELWCRFLNGIKLGKYK